VSQYIICLLDQCRHRCEDEHIVVPFSAGKLHQLRLRVAAILRVQVHQPDIVLGSLLNGIERSQPGRAASGQCRSPPATRVAVFPVDREVDGRESHGTDTGEDRHVAALHDLHPVDIAARGGVVVGVHGTDNARQGLSQ
jgi:hypothetical protein